VQSQPVDSRFENLFDLCSDFDDFNWTTFLGRLEQPKGEYIARILGHAFEVGDSGELDPSLIETLARTLAPSSCKAFFRAHSDYPFTDRDYYLSKVFQFTWVALTYGGFDTCPELWDRLSAVTNEIPDAELLKLHQRFSVWRLFRWTRNYVADTAGLIDNLELDAFLDEIRRTADDSSEPEEATLAPIDREKLYADWKSRHPEYGARAKLLAQLKKLGTDPADFGKWQRGAKFSDDSQVSIRIVRALTE